LGRVPGQLRLEEGTVVLLAVECGQFYIIFLIAEGVLEEGLASAFGFASPAGEVVEVAFVFVEILPELFEDILAPLSTLFLPPRELPVRL
jgi:hypothetical protein